MFLFSSLKKQKPSNEKIDEKGNKIRNTPFVKEIVTKRTRTHLNTTFSED